jgi:hypothetical protein
MIKANGIQIYIKNVIFVEWDYTNEELTFPSSGLPNVLYIEKNSSTMWYFDVIWKGLTGIYN